MTSAAPIRQFSKAIGQTYKECPLCSSENLEYEFVVDKAPVCGCAACGLLFLNPQPKPAQDDEVLLPPTDRAGRIHETNAIEKLRELIAYSGRSSGRLLCVGADPFLPDQAAKLGFDCLSMNAAEFEGTSDQEFPKSVDAAIFFCALEKMSDPSEALRKLRRVMGDYGTLMVVSPTTDSRAARIFRNRWWEFRRSNRFYYSIDTLQSLLLRAGFGDPIIRPDKSVVSLNYLENRLSGPGTSLKKRRHLLRASLSVARLGRNRSFRLLDGRTRILVRCKTFAVRPVLSVIVPVYNEKATFEELMNVLLAKTIDVLDIQIIVVESNSVDGTREAALKFKDHDRVRLVLQDRPSGKGHAVRAGLAVATGDFIIIQDADLEYDINDYDALLAPLLRYERNFVLGSRHVAEGNSWKIRDFEDASALAAYFNVGHLLFLKLFNLIYRQKLTDPFTMFKVFRRECLYGLVFETNRFDFDIELVIRLLRKGYRATEIPVNYKSRSVADGKKVRAFADPLTWLWAYVKYRFAPLYGQK